MIVNPKKNITIISILAIYEKYNYYRGLWPYWQSAN